MPASRAPPSQRGPKPSKQDVRVSKFLSYILRHGANKYQLPITKEGYMRIDSLLLLPELHGVFRKDIYRIVREDEKQRYTIKDGYIRANQGHSIGCLEEEAYLHRFASAEELPICIHATHPDHVDDIVSKGLDRMQRDHIHFTTQERGPHRKMTRASATVDIYIDVPKAMRDGHVFWRSDNGVVLTKGPLSSSYFAKIVRS